MKRIFTLIIAVLTVVSLMGQGSKSTSFTEADLHQKSIKKVMEMFSPSGLDKDYKKHPEFTKSKVDNKSGYELKQVLDSMDIIAEGMVYAKERYTYNNQGNCIEIEELSSYESNTMEPYSKNLYTFDASGNISSYTYVLWDEDLNDWLNFFKIEYSYSNGLMINGNMSSWDSDSNIWDLIIKDEFTYDAQNRLTTIMSLVNNNGTWENAYKEEVIYNAAGYSYLWMDYDWNSTTNLWIPYSKDEDFFDANGDVEMNLQSEWEDFISVWLDLYKDEYTYDANHQMLTDIYSEFDESTMQWDIWFKDEYSYDENGNYTIAISSDWDGSAWVLWIKEELIFDYSFTTDLVVYPNDYEYEFSHMIEEVNYFFWDEAWYNEEKIVFHYSEKDVNGIADISNSEIQIYPNPSTGIFNVELSGFGPQFSISVLDFAGRVMEKEEVNTSANEYRNTLDLSKYSSGVYFLKFSNDSKSDFQKIVIQ